jgi:DNA mismatch repair ATPase MutS
MKQYNEIKRKYPWCLLVVSCKDFYDFGEDAVRVMQILGLAN